MSAVRGKTKEVEITLEEFVEHGMLWLVNASVFHPRGMALQYDDRLGVDTLRVVTTDPAQQITFDSSMEGVLNERFEAFERFVKELRG